MRRPYLLIAAAAIASAPLPVLAQTWSATVVAAAPRMTSQPRVPTYVVHRGMTAQRPAEVSPSPLRTRTLKLNPVADAEEIPEVEVRPKAEWSDDQGLRVGPTRLAYKSRF